MTPTLSEIETRIRDLKTNQIGKITLPVAIVECLVKTARKSENPMTIYEEAVKFVKVRR